MTKATRFSLLVLAAVVIGLTIFTYPSFWGFMTLLMRTVVIVGVLFVLVLLAAGTLKRQPGGAPIIYLVAALVVVGTAWPQIASRVDSNRFDAELEEAGNDNVFAVIASSETRAGTLIRESYEVAARTNAEIEGLIDITTDPAIVGLFDSTRVLDEAAVLDAAAVTTAFREGSVQLLDQIQQLKDAEYAEIDAIETQLPDSARLLFLDGVLQRVEAETAYYRSVAMLEISLAEVLGRMVDLLLDNPDYGFDDATLRPDFVDPADDEAFAALLEQRATIEAEIAAAPIAFDPTRVPAALVIVEGVGATP